MAEIKGGDQLERKLAQMAARLAKPGTLKVGFLSGARYPNGMSVAPVAAINNYGAPRARIPPRPFFSNMVADKQKEWPKTLANLLKTYDVNVALQLMGEGIKSQLQQSIIDTFSPPLSPVTLMLRKMKANNPDLIVTGRTVGVAAANVAAGMSYAGVSTKPLIATGHLLNSVEYKVSVT